MISWNEAFNRTVVRSKDFRLLFGRTFRIDEFNYYAHTLKFESLAPALLSASSATPNTGSLSATVAHIAAPTTNIVPGAEAESLVSFPAGAIILGITAGAILPQRLIPAAGDTFVAFKYGPSIHPGKRDLFLLDLRYSDTTAITDGNPVPQTSVDANFPVNSEPPILADALLGSGSKDIMPGRELLITPGLGIIAKARSMVLPNDPADSGLNAPTLSVHIVFHCMIPGKVTKKQAAA